MQNKDDTSFKIQPEMVLSVTDDEEAADEFVWAEPSLAKEEMLAGWVPVTTPTLPELPTYGELFGRKIVIEEADD